MLWSLLLFIVTISILVTIHEYGHFLVARMCGVQVECFSIGFGKKLWSHKFSSGTELVIAMIPLGGYVRMLDGRTAQLSENSEKFAFDKKKIWQRAAIVFAGPFANFILALIIYWIIFLMGVATYPVKIRDIIPSTPVATVGVPAGAELKTVNNVKVESWNDVNLALISAMGKSQVDFSYIDNAVNDDNHQEVHKMVNISNWHFDIEKDSAITAFGFIPKTLEIYPIVSKIIPGSAAEQAGLKVGDMIISYNQHPCTNWVDFTNTIKKAGTIDLKVNRNNEDIYLKLVPKVQKNGEGVAGFYPTSDAVITQYGFLEGFDKALGQTALTTQLTVRSLYQLVTGVIGLKHLSGPITIAKSAGQTASYGFTPYLYFLAFISISLGVINLVPLPMLDGGHLMFLFFEKIRGKALSDKAQERFLRAGLVLLMVIMGIALFNDFLRL
ncbi:MULTISPECIES: RIP metalloprotease RseP [unclassified Gilliamella]|uniref:RIP metalloprotease RseP n=1 Tax=unclassified Gilliamella TaxID=2685620 RepID=UPI00226ABF9B|nr:MULTISPECIES: RIP metalloprotease RseP [unclassified Gilliamella]MCX8627743.1 RIP metalloprotease RseP [Gilliamella sp. B3976]MCX8600318.1 RIP metalloprotease RseP [Gilliamella sp. B3722]MCX8609314.1 RIP metalloprotease RseP [Gilliamella sp. B3771]MCX8609533.1 RIP metalloprotease RseP [Gilliamella sp. B3891]MCX8612378.1 RIP metalloprotease RseP [Gilliamella sp. B3773]